MIGISPWNGAKFNIFNCFSWNIICKGIMDWEMHEDAWRVHLHHSILYGTLSILVQLKKFGNFFII